MLGVLGCCQDLSLLRRLPQLFYDFDHFKNWVADVRAKGIKAPIFPGIMPLNAYGGFKRMTGFCKTRIPPEMAKKVCDSMSF